MPFDVNKYIKNNNEKIRAKLDNDEHTEFEYNRNPFISSGRLDRIYFFIYGILLNLTVFLSLLTPINKYPLFSFLFYLSCCITGIFIVKKRIFDITLSNKKSWTFSLLLTFAYFWVCLDDGLFIYLIIPFYLWILFLPPQNEEKVTNSQKKCVIFFKKNTKIIITLLSIVGLCVIYNCFFRYEYKIYKHNSNSAIIIKLDKLTGKSTRSYPEPITYKPKSIFPKNKNNTKNTNSQKTYKGLYDEELRELGLINDTTDYSKISDEELLRRLKR